MFFCFFNITPHNFTQNTRYVGHVRCSNSIIYNSFCLCLILRFFIFTEDDYMVKNDTVVVPIAAIQLCGFMLGEPVVVKCGDKTFVKHVWPSEDLPLSNVYFSPEGNTNNHLINCTSAFHHIYHRSIVKRV